MRIVGGTWRGRRIEEPRGREVTRPTTDRVREACASIAESALAEGIEGACVLDAGAGAGAMGIEMRSRGAASCGSYSVTAAVRSGIRNGWRSRPRPTGARTAAAV